MLARLWQGKISLGNIVSPEMARPNKDFFGVRDSQAIVNLFKSLRCCILEIVACSPERYMCTLNSTLIHICSAVKKIRKHHCFGTVLKYIHVCMCVYVANGCVYSKVSLHSCAIKSTGMLGERGLELVVVLPLLRCC